MKRANLNFWVDAIAFAMFVFLVATGVLMEFILPAGSGRSTTIWGLDRHGWGSVHFWISVGFLTALALHVYLHWKWIVSVLRGRPREGSGVRVGLGILGLTALLAIAFAPLATPVERGSNVANGVLPRWDLSAEAELIQGSMTLGEVVEQTGVPLEFLVRELGLPDNTSIDDRLGRVARDNGLSVAEVREVVESGLGRVDEATDAVVEGPLAVSVRESGAPTVAEVHSTAEADGDPADREEPGDLSDRRVHEVHEAREDQEEITAGLADLRGSMTLAEVLALGVPREVLYRELGIPASIPINERLGRLGRTYGFSMTKVRDLVEVHR